MRKASLVTWLVLGVSTVLVACSSVQQKSPIDESSTHDGLERVSKPGIDAVYRKPGVDVSRYDKLLLRPIEVAFAKDWNPERGSGSALYQMAPPDRERIKSELATAFVEVFKKELEKGGYRIVDTSGPDVLEIRAALVNIYITAPDVSMQTAGRSRTFTADAGEMTLIAEIHDSVTGELLSRAYDRKEDMGGTWQWTNSITNAAKAKDAMRIWANTLRSALDASRSASTQRLSG